jgi:hypothetical protein
LACSQNLFQKWLLQPNLQNHLRFADEFKDPEVKSNDGFGILVDGLAYMILHKIKEEE